MTQSTHPTQVLGSARADHEILADLMVNVRKLFKGDRPPDATQQFATIQQLLSEKLSGHFTDEEKYLFPWIIAENPSAEIVRVIAELCAEHIQLLAEAGHLQSLLHHQNVVTCTGEVWIALLDFFCNLHAHATKEDQLFKFILI